MPGSIWWSIRLTAALSLVALPALPPHRQGPSAVSISGVVTDSLSHLPLDAANVQLVGVDSGIASRRFTAVTDFAGYFRVDKLPPGRYLVGFYHQTLDTLGVETRGQLVDARTSNQDVQLSGPSASSLIRAFCGDSPRPDSTTLLLGHVHDAADERAAARVEAIATWGVMRRDGTTLDVDGRTANTTARDDGLFALCGLPAQTAVDVRAVRMMDSTGAVSVRIPLGGVRHVTLFVGEGRSARGGRIAGRVVNSAGAMIAGAQISVVGASRTTTSGVDGRFALDSLPPGTQVVVARAIGYAPRTMPVRIAASDSTIVDLLLEKSVVLPTVYTLSSKTSANLALFEAHKRSAAAGFFVQPQRLEGYPAQQYLHSVVQGLPNVTVLPIHGAWTVLMYKPGTTMSAGPRDPCVPTLYLNGLKNKLDFDDLDLMISPDDILGVEVYRTEIEIPSIYELTYGRKCGLLSIWTKIHEAPPSDSANGKPPR